MRFLVCEQCNKNIDIDNFPIIEYDIDPAFYTTYKTADTDKAKDFIVLCAIDNNQPVPVFDMKKYHEIYDYKYKLPYLCGPLREPSIQEEYIQWIEDF